jgi:hypothetical protein
MAKLDKPNSFRKGPDERGRFGIYGGRFVAETLMPLILSLEKAYEAAKADPSFQRELDHFLKHYAGRPSPLYFAERLTERLGGAKIYFKRDELNHTGAHKINNVLGQILLARRMGKKRIIAETGAGQHGVLSGSGSPGLHRPGRFAGVRRGWRCGRRSLRLAHAGGIRRRRSFPAPAHSLDVVAGDWRLDHRTRRPHLSASARRRL